MKTNSFIFIAIAAGFITLAAQAQGTSSQNFIRTTIPTVETTNASGLSYTNSLQTIHYFDGLGRPFQTVQRGFSGSSRDVADYRTYNTLGLPDREWLPVNSTVNTGATVPLATIESQAVTVYNNDRKPYSEYTYEKNSLFRLTNLQGPGQTWDYPLEAYEYGSNSAGSATNGCLWYKATGSTTDTLVTIALQQEYPSGSLYLTDVTDNGYRYWDFRDKRGRPVMKREYVTGYNQTYYLYDDFDNLIAVLPPMASEQMQAGTTWNSKTSEVLKNYAYLYQYDKAGRCIAKKLPGASWILYVYDRAGRLIFTQDGEMRLRGEWLFTLPDATGRTVLTGTCKNNLSHTAGSLDATLVKATWSGSSTNMGYTLSGVSLSSPVILSANYYDHYGFMGKNGIPDSTHVDFRYETLSGYGTREGGYQELLTGSWNAMLDGTDNPVYSVTYYDRRARPIQTKANNHLAGGLEKHYLAYNFTGLPTKLRHLHSATGKTALTEDYTYTYDHAMRPATTRYQLTAGTTTLPEVTLATRTYNDLGQLASLTRHNLAILKEEYTYDIRSNPYTTTGTLYQEIIYRGEYPPSLQEDISGNVGTACWKVAGEDHWRIYTFYYDYCRLRSAVYWEGEAALNKDRFTEQVTYDKNGNILTLQRNGKTSATTYGLVDNLTLTYNGNQLATAYNAVGIPSARTTHTFKYNTNGNLIYDSSKNISNIEYNLLNLPNTVRFTNGNTLDHMYSADATKRRTTRTAGSTIDYCRNVIYDNGVLSMIMTDEGYVTLSGTTPSYHYYLKDFQGNVRVVADHTGTLEQVNHYYPYGGLFGEGVQNTDQPYRYGMKELEEQSNTYDFSARYLSSSYNRFTTMDPKAEKYYEWTPYSYALNNPLRYTDPTGEDIWILDNQGRIINVLPTTDADAFIVNKNDGTSAGYILDYGTVESQRTISYLDEGKRSSYDIYQVRGDEQAENIFKFLAKNTQVEWGRTLTGEEGERGLNFLTTSHHEAFDKGVPELTYRQLRHGYTYRGYHHSHPNNATHPSGIENPEKGDIPFANWILKYIKPNNPSFLIFTPGNGQYHDYSKYLNIKKQ